MKTDPETPHSYLSLQCRRLPSADGAAFAETSGDLHNVLSCCRADLVMAATTNSGAGDAIPEGSALGQETRFAGILFNWQSEGFWVATRPTEGVMIYPGFCSRPDAEAWCQALLQAEEEAAAFAIPQRTKITHVLGIPPSEPGEVVWASDARCKIGWYCLPSSPRLFAAALAETSPLFEIRRLIHHLTITLIMRQARAWRHTPPPRG